MRRRIPPDAALSRPASTISGGSRLTSSGLLGGLVALAVAGAAGAPPAAAPAPSAASLTPAQLAGQRMVFGFPGTVPPPDLVRRIRRGEAGAVILLGPNVPSPAAARALTRRLQAIPRPAAVDVPLLVMIDQEGGLVRRLDGPPSRSAADMGREGGRVERIGHGDPGEAERVAQLAGGDGARERRRPRRVERGVDRRAEHHHLQPVGDERPVGA